MVSLFLIHSPRSSLFFFVMATRIYTKLGDNIGSIEFLGLFTVPLIGFPGNFVTNLGNKNQLTIK